MKLTRIFLALMMIAGIAQADVGEWVIGTASGGGGGGDGLLVFSEDGVNPTAVLAEEMDGRWHFGVLNPFINWNLPAAAEGLHACFQGIRVASTIAISPLPGDTILLDGAAKGVGVGISASPGQGAQICVVGTATNEWITYSRVLVWT